MLFIDGMSGAPPFSGWYSDLLYRLEMSPDHQYEGDGYVVADVHTQPTDEFGNVVGHVLHVGVGKVNLGIFLADSPSNGYAPMAYVGPVMSYYEKITTNFKRLTDEEWVDVVTTENLPERPDWVNVYLTDKDGVARGEGRELRGVTFLDTKVDGDTMPATFVLLQNYPNPFNPGTTINYRISSGENIRLAVYDVLGKELAVLVNKKQRPGSYSVHWNAAGLSSGVYFALLQAGSIRQIIKMMLLR